jgi:hypothetical protein
VTVSALSLIVQTITLIAIVIGGWQLLVQNRQIHRDFESMYVQRYWTIMDRRSRTWTLEGQYDSEDRVIARQYLLLCEDEIDLRARGRITDATWAFWGDAILTQATAAPYAAELTSSAPDEYLGLRAFLESKGDPLHHQLFWRRSHGL